MDQRMSLVTLAVADLEATRRFYVDGLGWEPMIFVAGDVLMIKVADKVILSLWDRDHFEAEVGPIVTGQGVAPLTLAHNVGSREEVDQVLATAREVGADPVHDGVDREWGGYTGYFGDPDGYRWEVAWAPGDVGAAVLP
ncbi:MAG TPA: VOC family protein [Nocardioides sp.]|jgi:predicted lactoylglutathione lyase|nr:VOC family protein [Nocardioides sp.]